MASERLWLVGGGGNLGLVNWGMPRIEAELIFVSEPWQENAMGKVDCGALVAASHASREKYA